MVINISQDPIWVPKYSEQTGRRCWLGSTPDLVAVYRQRNLSNVFCEGPGNIYLGALSTGERLYEQVRERLDEIDTGTVPWFIATDWEGGPYVGLIVVAATLRTVVVDAGLWLSERSVVCVLSAMIFVRVCG